MSDITLINDSEQSSLVTNGLAKTGELYLKKAGSTDAGSVVVYDSGAWKTFTNEYSASVFDSSLTFPTIQVFDTKNEFTNQTDAPDYTIVHAKDTDNLYVWDGGTWYTYNNDSTA
jgi:hypothetical protein